MLSMFAAAPPFIGGRLCNAVALSGAERAITALSGHLANAARAPSMESKVIVARGSVPAPLVLEASVEVATVCPAPEQKGGESEVHTSRVVR